MKRTQTMPFARAREGSVIVFLSVSMITLLAFLGLLIDTAIWYDAKMLLQSIADQAALAGALKLPDAGQGAAAALEVVTANGASGSEILTSRTLPVGSGSPNQYEVVMQRQQPAIFAGVVGFSSVTISVRAIAQVDSSSGGGGGYSGALAAVFYVKKEFQSGTTPAVFTATGSNNRFNGDLLVNCSFTVSGNNNDFDGQVLAGHAITDSGNHNDFNGGQTPNSPQVPAPTLDTSAALVTAKAAGTYYVYASGAWKQWNPATGALVSPAVPPTGWTFGGSNLTCSGSSRTISGTLYLEGGGISLSGSNLNGTATFVTDQRITVSGSNIHINPAAKLGFVSLSSHSSALSFTGSNCDWNGAFVAPNGGLSMTGSNVTINGGVYVNTVTSLSGSNNTFNYGSTDLDQLPLVETPTEKIHLVQ